MDDLHASERIMFKGDNSLHIATIVNDVEPVIKFGGRENGGEG